ncbi:MAG: DUF1127 domain-containing protein [Kiloniellaceae bacterium]
MTIIAIRRNHAPYLSIHGLAAAAIQGVLRAAAAWYRHRQSRIQLDGLTPELLRDVGIDPGTIRRGPDVPGDPWTTSRLMSLR